jgi:hypothetical protein
VATFSMQSVTHLKRALLATLVALVAIISGAWLQPQAIEQLQSAFLQPPDDSRIMMRWWWFGPSVTKPEIEREMRVMKAAGIGGFEVQPVYPLTLAEAGAKPETMPYLSDGFIDALRFTSEKARELGLRIDLTIGSGWPYGGPSVAVDQAASRLRVERFKPPEATRRVAIPSIGAGEKLIAVFVVDSGNKTPVSTREITSTVRDGIVTIPADITSRPEVLFFVASRTGQQVKRPSVGAEGFVLDHLDKSAVDHYLRSVGDRLFEAFGSTPPNAIFCDSLEIYLSDWAPDFLQEFQRRRGYDLTPYLPALVVDIGEATAGVRHDWGQTLTELLDERFLATMRDWSRRKSTLFRIQGYGVPPMTLSGNSYADLPEGEGSQWKIVRASRWASSASHIYGRPVTSSETWTWLHSPSFRATPVDIKAEADLHFLQGINQLIGHGWPYTPEGTEYPGNRFYAAAAFDEKNPWWIAMPDISRYLQRVSFMMRQGSPANDVALYLPNSDGWSSLSNGRIHMIETLKDLVGPNVMPSILEAGFNLDFFDDDALKAAGRVRNGNLEIGSNAYKIVLLPGVERIPLDTLKKFDEFVASGGILIASKRVPDKAPGLKTPTTEHLAVKEIAQRLFAGASPRAHLVLDDRAELRSKLRTVTQPDISLSTAMSEIGFVHRHTADAEIYFVANTSNAPQDLQARFRVKGLNAEEWNPATGEIAALRSEADATGTSIRLRLQPYGSTLVVFSKRNSRPAAPREEGLSIDLNKGWRLTFHSASGPSPSPITMDVLRSWTESEASQYFSGTVDYETEFTADLKDGAAVSLDLGEGRAIPPTTLKDGMRAWYEAPVREAAEVFVNGQRAGSLWHPPYSLDVTRYVKPGINRLRLVVGNTAINYMSGHRLPDYKLLNLRYGERFQPQDMNNLEPLPSGILGTVRVRIAK